MFQWSSVPMVWFITRNWLFVLFQLNGLLVFCNDRVIYVLPWAGCKDV